MTRTNNHLASLVLLLGSLSLLGSGCEADDLPADEMPPITDTAPEADDGEGTRAWSGYVSEEQPPTICANNYAVRGFDCSGSYCDNVSINCRPVFGHPFGNSIWTPYFSEEGSTADRRGRCAGPQRWMTGVACSGSYCDNLSIRCTQFPGSSPSNCEWSGWYSEEQSRFNAPSGYFIKAVECSGSYCDNKRYRYCRMN